ncbi:MAG TPA: hypothetical protein VEA58_02060 [Anaerovoracaceae bacterium]|nr:hypothetical protein [Anaerovoracaceae bacterium]
MIKRMLANERGFSTTFFAVMMPLILTVVGLCVDGAFVIYYRISLETTAEAASFSAIDAYDRTIWNSERTVVIREDWAMDIASAVIHENLPDARLIGVEVPEDNKETCIVTVEMDVPTFFLNVVGISEYHLTAKSSATGY